MESTGSVNGIITPLLQSYVVKVVKILLTHRVQGVQMQIEILIRLALRKG